MPTCNYCGKDVSYETEEQETSYGYAVHVTYCPECGEVVDASP